MSAIVRAMRQEDLECVLKWRNHPSVRNYMYTRHEITASEHQLWFESSLCNKERSLLIFELNDVPQGFVNITQAKGGIADWGFYLAPDAPRGTGRMMGNAALEFAFGALRLHKVCGQALGFNERSVRFHLSLGFTQEGTLREQHYDGACYHDIIHFGLFDYEWEKEKKDV